MLNRLKFGIKVPQTIQEALQIDKDSNTNFWRKAIENETSAVCIPIIQNDTNVI